MATFFDSASLVMIPSGYKDDKLYSIKPTDGSGDFTFSRDGAGASPATRVNASGLIEKGRENITLYSNDFSNWTANNTTITSDSITGPFGTDSADLMTLQATTDEHNVYYSPAITTSANNVYTQSFYVKKGTGRYMAAWMYFSSNLGGPYATYDLDTNTLVASGTTAAGTTYIDSAIEVLSGGWVRISVTGISSSSTSIIPAIDARTSGSLVPQVAFLGAGETYYIYGAQLEQGLISTSYIETTTAPVSAGLLGDMPRLDYSGGATCPSLLLEPSRVNLVTLSEYIGGWSGTNMGVVNNDATSPESVINAAEIESTSTNASHYIGSPNFSMTSGVDYTGSMFVKAKTGRYFQLFFGGISFTSVGYANFDLQEGVVTAEGSAVTGDIEPYGNDWYRVSISGTSAATGSATLYAAAITSGSAARIEVHNSVLSYNIWGAQCESGSYPTSYIPTYGSASTRGADYGISNSISSLFGSTEGSFYIEIDSENMEGIPLFLESSDSAGFNYATYLQTGTSSVTYSVYSGGVSQVSISSSGHTAGQNLKVACAYKQNDFVMYVNGVLIGTDSNGDISTNLNKYAIGRYPAAGTTFQYNGNVKQALLFPTRLTNAELAALTTI